MRLASLIVQCTDFALKSIDFSSEFTSLCAVLFASRLICTLCCLDWILLIAPQSVRVGCSLREFACDGTLSAQGLCDNTARRVVCTFDGHFPHVIVVPFAIHLTLCLSLFSVTDGFDNDVYCHCSGYSLDSDRGCIYYFPFKRCLLCPERGRRDQMLGEFLSVSECAVL